MKAAVCVALSDGALGLKIKNRLLFCIAAGVHYLCGLEKLKFLSVSWKYCDPSSFIDEHEPKDFFIFSFRFQLSITINGYI
jgi:hypothetical protein